MTIFLRLFNRCVVKADDGGVEIEIRIQSSRFPDVLWQCQLVWEEHKGIGQFIVQGPMSFPEETIHEILGTILGLFSVDVMHYGLEHGTYDNGAGKSRVPCAFGNIIQKRGLLLLST